MPTSAEPVVYLDSSAIVKLVVREAESDALLRHLASQPVRVSSALARVEVARAVRAHGRIAADRAQRVLDGLALLALDDPLLREAGALDGDLLRSLDAIHLAAALSFGDELGELITYDRRMTDHARALGMAVTAPG